MQVLLIMSPFELQVLKLWQALRPEAQSFKPKPQVLSLEHPQLQQETFLQASQHLLASSRRLRSRESASSRCSSVRVFSVFLLSHFACSCPPSCSQEATTYRSQSHQEYPEEWQHRTCARSLLYLQCWYLFPDSKEKLSSNRDKDQKQNPSFQKNLGAYW